MKFIIGIIFIIWAFASLLILRDGSIGAFILAFGIGFIVNGYKEMEEA